MMTYWSNFARAGDPNGPGHPAWPRYEGGPHGQVMHLDETSQARPDTTRARYETLDALAAAARAQGSESSPNDTLVSAEIASDRRVTFRIYAPKASEVALTGDLIEGYGMTPLTRDGAGVWSVTVGPLAPDYYSYSFVVDGVKTIDPKNPEIKQGIRSIDNMLMVSGPEAAFQEARLVPHGEIRIAWYLSTTLGGERRLHVYTPPGYDASTDRYPVFYLLHGGGDEDSGWSTIGRAGFIMDNLLADGKALPMVIVMPNGSLPRPADMPRFVRGVTPSPEALAAWAALQASVHRRADERRRALHREDLPRPLGSREPRDRRPVDGRGPDPARPGQPPRRLRWVAIWSAGLRSGAVEAFEKDASASSARRKRSTRRSASSRSGWARRISLSKGSRNLSELLTKHEIEHTLEVNDGGHTWINWRLYLSELLPKLFR